MPGKLTHDRHQGLMTRMAETLGADLEAAELRGDLPPEMRDEMLSACTGCSDPRGCQHWLDTHHKAEAAPDYCRNGALLRHLAAE